MTGTLKPCDRDRLAVVVGSLSGPSTELTEQAGSSSPNARRRGDFGKESRNYTGLDGSSIKSGRKILREHSEHLQWKNSDYFMFICIL